MVLKEKSEMVLIESMGMRVYDVNSNNVVLNLRRRDSALYFVIDHVTATVPIKISSSNCTH